jgi:hypothetical protein
MLISPLLMPALPARSEQRRKGTAACRHDTRPRDAAIARYAVFAIADFHITIASSSLADFANITLRLLLRLND